MRSTGYHSGTVLQRPKNSRPGAWPRGNHIARGGWHDRSRDGVCLATAATLDPQPSASRPRDFIGTIALCGELARSVDVDKSVIKSAPLGRAPETPVISWPFGGVPAPIGAVGVRRAPSPQPAWSPRRRWRPAPPSRSDHRHGPASVRPVSNAAIAGTQCVRGRRRRPGETAHQCKRAGADRYQRRLTRQIQLRTVQPIPAAVNVNVPNRHER